MGFTLRRSASLMAAGLAAISLGALGSGVASAEPAAPAPQPVAAIQNLTGTSTSVALDSGFVDALKSLAVTPSPSGEATVTDGVAKFPITGGNVTVYKPGEVDPYVQGKILHEGSGLTLTKGDTTVQLENFVIDPGKPATLTGRVTANGQVAGEAVPLFDLDGSTLQPITTQAEAGTATLTGTTVNLTSGAAQALNEAFKTDALKGGTKIGIATIVVKLPGQMTEMPAGGVNTGGGSTSGIENAGLLGAGGAALLAAVAVGAFVIRRRNAPEPAVSAADKR